MMNCLQDRFVNLAAQRAQVYMRLQRTGYTTREIGRLVGTSNAAVVQSLKGAQFDAENNR
jgi:predicted transcriptional regulator